MYDRSLYALKNSVFIGKTQQGGAYEDRGSKLSPNCCNSRVFAAWVWSGGHTKMVGVPDFERLFYPVSDFSFQLLELMKRPLIVGFN